MMQSHDSERGVSRQKSRKKPGEKIPPSRNLDVHLDQAERGELKQFDRRGILEFLNRINRKKRKAFWRQRGKTGRKKKGHNGSEGSDWSEKIERKTPGAVDP